MYMYILSYYNALCIFNFICNRHAYISSIGILSCFALFKKEHRNQAA